MGELGASVSLVAILPEVALVLGAVLVLLVDVTWKPDLRVHAILAAASIAGAAGGLLAQWLEIYPDTEGIAGAQGAFPIFAYSDMVVIDPESILFRAGVVAITAIGTVFAWRLIRRLGRKGAEALALVLIASSGFLFMVSAGHFMMLFLGLEVGSISLYVLAGISNEHKESDEAAMKYFLLGSVASAIFLYGVALLYTATGTMTYAGTRGFLLSLGDQIVFRPAIFPLAVGLILVGFLFKIGAAPFHAWAPDVYQGAPAGITGYMSAVAKVAAIGAILRMAFVPFSGLVDTWQAPLAGVAAVSVVVGTLYAVVQSDLRRILAYSGVAHAGFLLVGVATGTTGSARGVAFYVLTYVIVLAAAFGIVGAVSGASSSGSPLDAYRGLSKSSPGAAASLSVLMLALAGMPVTSGFVAKFGVFTAAWRGGFQWLVLVALVASVAAFAFYLRVIVLMYFEEGDGPEVEFSLGTRISTAVVLILTIGLGVYPTPLLELIDRAFF